MKKCFIKGTGKCFQTKLSILCKFLEWDLVLSIDLKVVYDACIINVIDLLMMLSLYFFQAYKRSKGLIVISVRD